ncbi:hypothetical protein [Mycoplasma yeatsii]|uniref:hypothetical protein n=1 Tax=Mycoplasma yeatsii TaxID=51365 RepID=UPI0005B242A5|nr:hypothetical protein [Mycoplasma yeatsii]AJM71946.1 membrane protein [Mycoplasma yeatsii GM274B]
MFLLTESNNVNKATTNMPVWLIVIIFILGIIGVAVAAWGAKSGFSWREILNAKNKDSNKVKRILSTRKNYNWIEVSEAEETGLMIIGVSFKNAVYSPDSIPVLLLKSLDFSKSIRDFKKDLETKKNYKKFFEYMHKMNFKKEDIIFIVIDKAESVEELDHSFNSWLSIVNAKSTGLN